MNKIDALLVTEAEKYVMHLLKNRLSNEYVFHSPNHTLNVMHGAAMIGSRCNLNEDDMNLLKTGALFHDTGYTISQDNHEDESAFIAAEFLRLHGVDEGTIGRVGRAIQATRVPQRPLDRISEVLCDADLIHLASDDYFEQMELLRLEWQMSGRHFFRELEFHLNSVEFFRKHHFHSEYGRSVLELRKAECLAKIHQRIDALKTNPSLLTS
jgi:predicted metal-dependent HD superfamily phosphohydrolase